RDWSSDVCSSDLVERYAMEACVPPGGPAGQRKYWRCELAFIARFFTAHPFHYQYYRLGATELDGLYFTRGAELPDVLVPEVPDVDGATGTKMGYLFAKFMAYERLRSELVEVLHAPESTGGRRGGRGKELRWTGESANLIELAYGLHGTKQINGGAVDIGDIVGWLEESF